MTTRTEKFLVLFNRLEELFKEELKLNYHMPFVKMVKEIAKKDSYIRMQKNILEDLAELRNVLVHGEGKDIIAIPSDKAIEWLQEILDAYLKPMCVMEVCNRQVITVDDSNTLYEVLMLMKKIDYSKFPVYNKQGCIGILSGSTITRWLARELTTSDNVISSLFEISVGEVLISIKKRLSVEFIPRTMPLFDFVNKNYNARPKSSVYIITEHGKDNEKPIGIITEYDYSKIVDKLSALSKG